LLIKAILMDRPEENYIKDPFFHLGRKGTEEVATNAIARLNRNQALLSVTIMIKKICRKKIWLISTNDYRVFR